MKADGAKLCVYVSSHKRTHEITTVSVFDMRTKTNWTDKQIEERGISRFLNLTDMKETLNWNLCGDSSKYRFKFGTSGKTHSAGIALIFD